jgi:hypothetical protein
LIPHLPARVDCGHLTTIKTAEYGTNQTDY